MSGRGHLGEQDQVLDTSGTTGHHRPDRGFLIERAVAPVVCLIPSRAPYPAGALPTRRRLLAILKVVQRRGPGGRRRRWRNHLVIHLDRPAQLTVLQLGPQGPDHRHRGSLLLLGGPARGYLPSTRISVWRHPPAPRSGASNVARTTHVSRAVGTTAGDSVAGKRVTHRRAPSTPRRLRPSAPCRALTGAPMLHTLGHDRDHDAAERCISSVRRLDDWG